MNVDNLTSYSASQVITFSLEIQGFEKSRRVILMHTGSNFIFREAKWSFALKNCHLIGSPAESSNGGGKVHAEASEKHLDFVAEVLENPVRILV